MRPSSALLVGIVKLLVGAYARWVGTQPTAAQRIYFANHTSHIDTLAIWSSLPRRPAPAHAAHRRTRLLGQRVCASTSRRVGSARSSSIARAENPESDPLDPLRAALREGDSLIIFPEGTRGASALPAPFRSGLFRLASEFPGVELVPVYLDNLHRSLPKGAVLPVPVVCTVRFGAPLALQAGEDKAAFLGRARDAVIALGRPA